jgi:hypothetical protein
VTAPAPGTATTRGTKRAVIHIGIEKTATTTAQTYLFTNRRELLTHRILVPSLALNLSVYLSVIFRDRTPGILPLVDRRAETATVVPKLAEEYRASLESEIRGRDWDTLVISAEALCDYAPNEVAHFKAWLEEMGVEDFGILGYVRDPGDWARSVTQQRLKAGQTLEELYANPRLPNWRRRFSPWIDAFGRSNFTVIAFEDARSNGIVHTFCGAAGIPQLGSEPRARNESMSMEAALIMSHLNAVRPLFVDGARSESRRWWGAAPLAKIPGAPFVLPASVRDTVTQKTSSDMSWLHEEFGVPMYEPQVAAPPSNESGEWRGDTLDALALLLSDLGNGWTIAEERAKQPAGHTGASSALRRGARAVRRRVHALRPREAAARGKDDG